MTKNTSHNNDSHLLGFPPDDICICHLLSFALSGATSCLHDICKWSPILILNRISIDEF